MYVCFFAAKNSLPDTRRLRENGEIHASVEPSPISKAVDERNHEHEAEKLSSDRPASSTDRPDDGEADRPQRPMSPGTLALMCDEKDPLFTAPPSPISGLAAEEVSTSGSSHAALLYAEQERAILLEYRDCLRKIISVGSRRGTFPASFLQALGIYPFIFSVCTLVRIELFSMDYWITIHGPKIQNSRSFDGNNGMSSRPIELLLPLLSSQKCCLFLQQWDCFLCYS